MMKQSVPISFQDIEMRDLLELTEIPNDLTLKSFAEDKSCMPVFTSLQSLREDLFDSYGHLTNSD